MSTTGILSRVKDTTQSLTTTLRPWRDFLDPTALSLPLSVSDATTRISQNLTHFFSNYILILLLCLFLSLLYHPISLIVFLFLFAAWLFFFFSRSSSEPLLLFNFPIDDRLIAIALGILTVVALVLTHVWFNVVVSLAVGAALVSFHAAIRGTEDLVRDDQESPYGALLSDSPGGVYAGI